ncbi:hypothetical protein Tco_0748523 [Tanacetum coccineum]|uniref:Zinc knuckle CX2CX4HX4C n=1 Tax=Tanacetum coccineum TaxID=301880 RepID=A0ABQ4YYL1_9ASTR
MEKGFLNSGSKKSGVEEKIGSSMHEASNATKNDGIQLGKDGKPLHNPKGGPIKPILKTGKVTVAGESIIASKSGPMQQGSFFVEPSLSTSNEPSTQGSMADLFKSNQQRNKKIIKVSHITTFEEINGADVAIPKAVVDEVREHFSNTLYGYFIGIPLEDGLGHSMETIEVEFEWKPPHCGVCKTFGHTLSTCPKRTTETTNSGNKNTTKSDSKSVNTADEEGFVEVSNRKKKGKNHGKSTRIDGIKFTKPKASFYQEKKGPKSTANQSKASTSSSIPVIHMIRLCLYGWWLRSTSPSGEKLKAEIAVLGVVSEAPPNKVGSPGGPLASKIFIFVILYLEIKLLIEVI